MTKLYRGKTLITWLLIATLSVFVTCIIVLASVPPVDRDALTHHLAVPTLYLKYGGVVEIPWVPFSYFPMNLDLIYLIPLYFGNDIIPKYIHFAFALLTGYLIFGYLKQRTGKNLYGLLGALLFISLPVVVKLSITVYVDLGLIFFSTAALLYILKWAANGYSARHLILSGVFCGLALGTKYNGLVTFFLLACLAPVLYAAGGGSRSAAREEAGRATQRSSTAWGQGGAEGSCLRRRFQCCGAGGVFAMDGSQLHLDTKSGLSPL